MTQVNGTLLKRISLWVVSGHVCKCVQPVRHSPRNNIQHYKAVMINLWPKAEYIISERSQSYSWFPFCRLRQSPFSPCPDFLHPSEAQTGDPGSRTDTWFLSPTTSKYQQVTGGDLRQAGSSWAHSGSAVFCNLYSCFKGWSDRWEKKVPHSPFWKNSAEQLKPKFVINIL